MAEKNGDPYRKPRETGAQKHPINRRGSKGRVALAWIEPFLESIAAGNSISKSCKIADIAPHTAHERRDKDEEFAKRWVIAYAAGTDVLRDEIKRRAVDGWTESERFDIDPDSGERRLVARTTKYSDSLLALAMKQRDHSYRENAIKLEHSGQIDHQLAGLQELLGGRQPVEVAGHQRRQAAAELLRGVDAEVTDAEVVE